MLIGKRRFFYIDGHFLVIAESNSKNGRRIALGPDRKMVHILFSLFALCGVGALYIFRYCESGVIAWIAVISYFITVISYFLTSCLDPGMIKPNENNSIENKSTLEPLDYSFCSICQVYRPSHAYHCDDCNACFNQHDHHCSFMGQCVAQRNTISFYVFIVSVMLTTVALEIGLATTLSSHSEGVERNAAFLYQVIVTSVKNTFHLRK